MVSDGWHLWLRNEVLSRSPRGGGLVDLKDELDARTPLTPDDAATLVKAGIKVTVEKSFVRCFPDEDYEAVGCVLAEPGAWRGVVDKTIIMGIRDFERSGREALQQTHMFFSHTFKRDRPGWQRSLSRFVRGGGQMMDFEFLMNDDHKRVTGFGQMAGSIGVATGVLAWSKQHEDVEIHKALKSKLNSTPLEEHLQSFLSAASGKAGHLPSVLVIGGAGRCGAAAVEFAQKLGLKVDSWDHETTRSKKRDAAGEIVKYDILVNAIRLRPEEMMEPFLTNDVIRTAQRNLSVIVDISCDVGARNNPLPIYSQSTTFTRPSIRILEEHDGSLPLDVIAIPNLPSLLPTDSSKSFSSAIVPHLLALPHTGWDTPMWQRCIRLFRDLTRPLRMHRVTAHASHLPLTIKQRMLLEALNNGTFSAQDCRVFRAVRLPTAMGQSTDVTRLRSAIHSVVDRHRILHARFTPGAQGMHVYPVRDEHLEQMLSLESCADVEEGLEAARAHVLDPRTTNGHSVQFTLLQHSGVLACQASPLVADTRSCLTLLHQVVRAYQEEPAATAGPGASADFGDFSEWMKEPTADAAVLQQADHDYWTQKIDPSAPVLQLATDLSRHGAPGYSCDVVSCQLPASLVSRVRAVARSLVPEQCKDVLQPHSVYALFMSVFACMLYRRTGESDLVLSGVHQGRGMDAAMQDMVGPLENPLCVRVPLQSGLKFDDCFRTLLLAVYEALQHQDLSFAQLASHLHQTRGSSRNGFSGHPSDASLSPVQLRMRDGMSGCGGLEEVAMTTEQSDMELALDVCSVPCARSGGSSLRLSLSYKRSLFLRESMDDLLLQLKQFLVQVTQDPSRDIMAYPLVTPGASEVLPDASITQDAAWPGPITQCFHQAALQHASKPAIVFQGQTVTYQVLHRRVNQLANYLQSHKVGKGDVVALYGHRSSSVVWAIMGILASGAAYTMMDPKYPAERIQNCLNIAKPKAWVAIGQAGSPPADLQTYLDGLGLVVQLTLPEIDSSEAEGLFPGCDDKEVSGVVVDKSDVAVITFTSGSTGLPKGVMGRHVSLTHFYPWMAERFGISASDRFSMCSGIAHDPLQRDIFTPLFFGASVYIPTDQDIAEPGALALWFRDTGVTISCLTPAMGQLLCSQFSHTLDKLRYAFFVGDMLIKRDVHKLRMLAPSCACINMYGSTETQRAVGYFQVPHDDASFDKLREVICVGEGMRDVDLLILNSAGVHCGVGELGEIYVRSPHMCKGYVGLPQQTSQRFLYNPFHASHDPNPRDVDRMYKTGDLGRYSMTGSVDCCGRADDQVKIRGFRIELGEINAFLSKHPLAKENVTVVREDKPGHKRLVSYVVPCEPEHEAGSDVPSVDTVRMSATIRAFLKEHLPHYMVPASVVILEALPLTPNGKINRRMLPPPESVLVQHKTDHTMTPLSDTEALLVPIWGKVLEVPGNTPSVHDNFFDLGGHSLLATQLTMAINQALGFRIPMSLLFKHPTVHALAKAIDSLQTPDGEVVEEVDLAKEVVLDASVVGANAWKDSVPYDASKPAANILLTGATGFVGSFILRELLQRSEAVVHCCLRAADEEAAWKRLQSSMEQHMVWNEDYRCRLRVVPSDLAQPLLGVSQQTWTELCGCIDVIIHNGAYVHWLLPYERMKATNVDGTRTILRMASEQRIKPVHHVSTTSVFDTRHHTALSVVHEDDQHTSSLGLSGGYPQSKWVAEQCVIKARAMGIPTSVYRPGYVCGDSQAGLWNTDDFLCRFTKGCIQLRSTPFVHHDMQSADSPAAEIDMSPVDYVAQVVTLGALRPGLSLGKSFNVVNPTPCPFFDFFEKISQFGYNVLHDNYETWRQRLLDVVSEAHEDGKKEANALEPILSQFGDGWINGLTHPLFDQCNVNALIADSDVTFPDLDAILPRYLSYFIRCGFLAPPTSRPSNRLHLDWDVIGEPVFMLSRSGRS